MSEGPIEDPDFSRLRETLAAMPSLEAVPHRERKPLVDETIGHVSMFMGDYVRDKLEARLGGFDRQDPNQSGSSTPGAQPPTGVKSVTCPVCATVFSVTCP